MKKILLWPVAVFLLFLVIVGLVVRSCARCIQYVNQYNHPKTVVLD